MMVGDETHPIAAQQLSELARVLEVIPSEPLAAAIDVLLEARATGRRVFVLGNGGSAATSSHLVCDLMKTARVGSLPPLRAFALVDNIPLLTAWANDESYERCFAEQLAALMEPGDVVIAISASGNSPNVVEALRSAVEGGARTIGFLGFDGGAARKLVDVALHIPSHDYGLVEAAHVALGHAITAAIREALVSRSEGFLSDGRKAPQLTRAR